MLQSLDISGIFSTNKSKYLQSSKLLNNFLQSSISLRSVIYCFKVLTFSLFTYLNNTVFRNASSTFNASSIRPFLAWASFKSSEEPTFSSEIIALTTLIYVWTPLFSQSIFAISSGVKPNSNRLDFVSCGVRLLFSFNLIALDGTSSALFLIVRVDSAVAILGLTSLLFTCGCFELVFSGVSTFVSVFFNSVSLRKSVNSWTLLFVVSSDAKSFLITVSGVT